MKESFSNTGLMKARLGEVRRRMKTISDRACRSSQLKTIIEDTLSVSGKMLRPVLMLLCAGMGGGDELLDAAAVIELTHTASLLHDDVVDDAPTRRNLPTVQAKYGKCAAVYAGDYLLSGSMRYLMSKGYSESGRYIAACVEKMCDGEMMQITNRGNTAVTESAYMQAIEGKTAALFEAASFLGGKLGTGRSGHAETLAALGKEIGIMFQLKDDLLDWTATEDTIGKPVNEDFNCGVYTLPAIHTFSSPDYGPALRGLAGSSEGADPARLRELVEKSGGIEYTRQSLRRHGESALAQLCSLPETQDTCMLKELIILIWGEDYDRRKI